MIKNYSPDSVSYYLNTVASGYLARGAFDSAGTYLYEALKYSQKTENPSRIAENLNNLGVMHYKLGSLDSSIHYYNAAFDAFSELRDTVMVSAMQINLGIVHKEKGLYEKSLEYLLAASRHLEKGIPSRNLASCYNTIGNVYSRIGELNSALEHHYKALAVRKSLGLQREIAASFNNIGNVYAYLEIPDSALHYFQQSLILKRLLKDNSGEATTLNNMGELLIKSGKLNEAENLLKESLAKKLESGDVVGEILTRNNLGNVHLLRGNMASAERELKKSERMASEQQVLERLKENYELQIQLYKEKGELSTALDYSQKLLDVKDQLLNQEKAESLAEMQTRYESMKKEDRITLLEKEGLLQAVELDRKQIWIRSLVLAVVLTLIIVVLIYYNLRTVRKNKIHIELLLKELHHRVKNNLQILSSLLSLQSQQLTDDTAIKAVRSSESRINAMALIHRKLYTVDQNRTVDIKEYITELIQYLVYSYGYHEKNFKLDLEIREISIDVDKAIPLGLILNELISNAFKHAYENQPNPSLRIDLAYPEADHELSIRIADNGRGMPAVDEKARKTFGMKIVSTLIKELKGSLNVKSDNGTTYDLHIPI